VPLLGDTVALAARRAVAGRQWQVSVEHRRLNTQLTNSWWQQQRHARTDHLQDLHTRRRHRDLLLCSGQLWIYIVTSSHVGTQTLGLELTTAAPSADSSAPGNGKTTSLF